MAGSSESGQRSTAGSVMGRPDGVRPSGALRLLGRLMSIWAAGTIVASALGLLLLPPGAGAATRAWQRGLARASAEAAGMSGTLGAAAQGLAEASVALEESGATLRQVRGSLEDSEPLLDSVGRLVGEDAPSTLEATRDAILDTRTGARAIDQVLRALAAVGFITGVRYDPEESLDESLAGVAEAIGPLPDSLRSAAGDLDRATAGFQDVRLRLSQSADEMRVLAISMKNLSFTLEAQQVAFDRLAASLESASERAAAVMTLAAGLLALALIGGGLTQAAVLMLGRALARGESVPPP